MPLRMVIHGGCSVRMCMDHWTRLREAITARGLSALVADSGEKAASNLASEVSDGLTVDNYDPLMSAHNAILNNSMDALGPQNALRLMTGDYCPLCVLNDLSRESWEEAVKAGTTPGDRCPCPTPGCTVTFPAAPDSYDGWIDRAADDQVGVWKSLTGGSGGELDVPTV